MGSNESEWNSGVAQERTLSIFFQINRQQAFELKGLDVATYVKLKHNDDIAYRRVQELLSSGEMVQDADQLETLYRSVDGIDFTRIKLPNELSSAAFSDSSSTISTPDTNTTQFSSSFSSMNSNCTPDNVESSEHTLAQEHPVCASPKEKDIHSAKKHVFEIPQASKSALPANVMSTKQASPAWKHFKKVDASSAQCNLCQKVLKHGGNTTNLMQHVNRKHAVLVSDSSSAKSTTRNTKRMRSESSSEDVDDPMLFHADKNTPPDRGDHKRRRSRSQPSGKTMPITEAFQRASSFSDGGEAADRLTHCILYMIAVDNAPLSIVEHEGFRTLMKTAVPQYRIPSRRTITKLIETKYEVMKESFKGRLANVSNFTLTCDNWTDVANQSYLGVTVHYYTDNALHSGCLGVIPLDESHTSAYLSEKLKSTIEAFGISANDITAVVSDSGANIKKAVCDTFGKSTHLACFAHILSNIVPHIISSMPEIQSLIAKVKNIVTLTKKSVVASDELKRLQIRDGKDEAATLKFIQDVPTRWNSTFYMLERFLILEEYAYPITLKCRNVPTMLTREEIRTLQDLVSLLRPIESVITQISGSLYPTCSIIIPIVHCMHVAIQNWRCDTDSSEENSSKAVTAFRERLLSAIEVKFKDHEANLILAISTILDPRFKKLHFQSARAAAAAILKINTLIKSSTSKNPSCDDKCKQSSSKCNDVWAVHDNMVNDKNSSIAGESDSFSPEIRQYLSQPVIPRTEDPFEHWQKLKLAFPSLNKVAMRYLSVVGTSVPSERLFSKAGAIKADKRSRLTGEHLNHLLFLGCLTSKDWGIAK